MTDQSPGYQLASGPQLEYRRLAGVNKSKGIFNTLNPRKQRNGMDGATSAATLPKEIQSLLKPPFKAYGGFQGS